MTARTDNTDPFWLEDGLTYIQHHVYVRQVATPLKFTLGAVAAREIALFFAKGEVLELDRAIEPWVYDLSRGTPE